MLRLATERCASLGAHSESFNKQREGKRMSSTADIFLKATLVGVGGTIVLDLYALMMSRVLGVPATNCNGRPLVRQYGSWPIRSGRAVQGRTGDWLDRALRNRHWAPAVRAVGQGLAGAPDTPSSDDPRLGAAGRALLNDDAGDGSGHCEVTNAQAKRHAAEKRDRPFGLRPRHVRDRTATRPVLADSGVRESNTSFGGGGHDGSELDPNGSTGDRSRHWPGHPAPGHARHGVGDRHYSMYACRGTL